MLCSAVEWMVGATGRAGEVEADGQVGGLGDRQIDGVAGQTPPGRMVQPGLPLKARARSVPADDVGILGRTPM